MVVSLQAHESCESGLKLFCFVLQFCIIRAGTTSLYFIAQDSIFTSICVQSEPDGIPTTNFKNCRIGQLACQLANLAELANSMVRYILIGQFVEFANSVLQTQYHGIKLSLSSIHGTLVVLLLVAALWLGYVIQFLGVNYREERQDALSWAGYRGNKLPATMALVARQRGVIIDDSVVSGNYSVIAGIVSPASYNHR